MNLLFENWIQGSMVLFAAGTILANYREFKILTAAKDIQLKFHLMPIVHSLLMPIWILCVPVLGLYRLAVRIILSIKHGSKFVGMLEGVDIILHLQNTTPYVVVFAVQYPNYSSKPFFDFIKETLATPFQSKFHDDLRIFGTVQTSLGYSYIVKSDITYYDCVTQIDSIPSDGEVLNRNEYTKLLSDNSHMSQNCKGLWEIAVGSQPVKLKTTQEKFYPVILKVNHVLGDVLHALKGVMNVLAEVETVNADNIYSFKDFMQHLRQMFKNKEVNKETKASVAEFAKKWKNLLKTILSGCYNVLVTPSVSLALTIISRVESNFLQGPKLSHQIIRCCSVEDSPHYMRVIKRIKKKIAGITFQEVLITAFTASITDCYKKHSAPIPEYLLAPTAIAPELHSSPIPENLLAPTSIAPELINLANFFVSDVKGKNRNCRNTALIEIRKLQTALVADGTGSSLVNSLKATAKRKYYSDYSVEVQVLDFMSNVLAALVPEPILMLFVKETDNFAAAVTNLLGPPDVLAIKEYPLAHMLCFGHLVRRIGIAFTSLSYGGRLALGFSIDKALISDAEEAQDIVDRVFKYVDLIDKECATDKPDV